MPPLALLAGYACEQCRAILLSSEVEFVMALGTERVKMLFGESFQAR